MIQPASGTNAELRVTSLLPGTGRIVRKLSAAAILSRVFFTSGSSRSPGGDQRSDQRFVLRTTPNGEPNEPLRQPGEARCVAHQEPALQQPRCQLGSIGAAGARVP